MNTKFELKWNYLTMLFWDVLAWIVRVDSWHNLRKESKTIYKLIKAMTKYKSNP